MNYNFDEKELFDLFVAHDDIYRPTFNNPYRRDGYVYASDGQKMVRVNESVVSGDYEVTDKMRFDIQADNCNYVITFEDIKKSLSEIPQIEEVEYEEVKCIECHGTGEVTWKYDDNYGETHGADFECPVCDGSGYVSTEKATGKMIPNPYAIVKVGKNGINNTFLQILLDAMKVVGVTEVRLVCQSNIINHFRIDENISVILASNIGKADYELKLREGGEK